MLENLNFNQLKDGNTSIQTLLAPAMESNTALTNF